MSFAGTLSQQINLQVYNPLARSGLIVGGGRGWILRAGSMVNYSNFIKNELIGSFIVNLK